MEVKELKVAKQPLMRTNWVHPNRQSLRVLSMSREAFPASHSKWKTLDVHCDSSQSIWQAAVSRSESSKLPELSFNRLQLSDEECIGLQRQNFGMFVAREAVLDEEYWTAAWLRAEAHWESLSYMRQVDSYKRKYAEQEFYALKRRCTGQDGNSLKCFCFVAEVEIFCENKEETLQILYKLYYPSHSLRVETGPERRRIVNCSNILPRWNKRLTLLSYFQNLDAANACGELGMYLYTTQDVAELLIGLLPMAQVKAHGIHGVVKKEDKNKRRTVLNSVVGTLDLSMRQFLQGETYPGEVKRLSTVFASQEPYDAHKYAYVANVCVSKFSRRQGIASNMLYLATDVANLSGMKQLFVHVNADNKPAQELYKKSGFKIVEAASSPLSKDQRLLMNMEL